MDSSLIKYAIKFDALLNTAQRYAKAQEQLDKHLSAASGGTSQRLVDMKGSVEREKCVLDQAIEEFLVQVRHTFAMRYDDAVYQFDETASTDENMRVNCMLLSNPNIINQDSKYYLRWKLYSSWVKSFVTNDCFEPPRMLEERFVEYCKRTKVDYSEAL